MRKKFAYVSSLVAVLWFSATSTAAEQNMEERFCTSLASIIGIMYEDRQQGFTRAQAYTHLIQMLNVPESRNSVRQDILRWSGYAFNPDLDGSTEQVKSDAFIECLDNQLQRYPNG